MNDVIEALERAVAWNETEVSSLEGCAELTDDAEVAAVCRDSAAVCKADAATIRQHIADLRAGKLVRQEDTDARVAAWLREFAGKADCRGCPNMEPNLSLNLAADAIERGEYLRVSARG